MYTLFFVKMITRFLLEDHTGAPNYLTTDLKMTSKCRQMNHVHPKPPLNLKTNTIYCNHTFDGFKCMTNNRSCWFCVVSVWGCLRQSNLLKSYGFLTSTHRVTRNHTALEYIQ